MAKHTISGKVWAKKQTEEKKLSWKSVSICPSNNNNNNKKNLPTWDVPQPKPKTHLTHHGCIYPPFHQAASTSHFFVAFARPPSRAEAPWQPPWQLTVGHGPMEVGCLCPSPWWKGPEIFGGMRQIMRNCMDHIESSPSLEKTTRYWYSRSFLNSSYIDNILS